MANVSNLVKSIESFDFGVYTHDLLQLNDLFLEFRNKMYLLKKVASDIDNDLCPDDNDSFIIVFSDCLQLVDNSFHDVKSCFHALADNVIFNADN